MAGFGSISSYSGGFSAAPSSNIGGNTGYSVVQPDGANTPYTVVQPQVFPTSKTSSESQNGNTSSRGGSSSSTNTSGTKNTSTSGSSSTTGSSTSAKRGNNTTTTNSQSTIDRFDPKSREAYNNLLGMLSSGGTAHMKSGMAALEALLGRSEDAEEEYTADNARAQAQRSTGKYARQLREEVMPAIYGAQEGAGLSGNSMTALLAQDQVARVSEAASAAELSAIEAYGELAQGQQGITADTATRLTQDPTVDALNTLLETGKGAYESAKSQSIVNEVINEITNTTSREDTATKSSSQETSAETSQTEETDWEDLVSNLSGLGQEDTKYQAFGGSPSGGNATRGFSSAPSSDSNEALATLMASLGPFQNLQDATDRSNPLNSFMSGTQQSGNRISDLARSLGVQL